MFQNLEVIKHIGLGDRVYYVLFVLENGKRIAELIRTPNGWEFTAALVAELAKAPK